MNLNFTTEYYPDIAELSQSDIATAREEVVLALQPVMPDVDLAPGSPTGDFVVTPLAVYRAAAGEANSRLMSDLDLSNVADGLIYSCDFVKAYLGNFSVYDVENLQAVGLARLTYSSPDARTIPRITRYRFGNENDWSIKVANPDAAEITILAPGSSHPGGADTYVLAQTASSTWAVDIPLVGVLDVPIVAGTGGITTELDDELVGIAAAIDFMSGLPSASLPELAKMARKIAFSLTAGSRASTKALVYRNWPEANMVSPVVPGDAELQRVAAGSAMALQAPAVDLYVRSSRDIQRETQNIRLEYVLPTGATDRVFRGVIPALHRPSRIVDIEWSGTTTTSRVTSYKVFSLSSRSDLYGSLHCGTRYEDMYVDLVPVLDGNDTPLIPILEDDEDGQYAIFTVTYDADPLLETISSLMESPEYRPAGVDVLVKSGPLVVLDDFLVTYSKKEGVKTTLSTAREKIVEYFRTAGYPDPVRISEVHDIMRNAGAERVISVNLNGRITVSAAEARFRSTITDPGGADILADWEVESDPFEVIPLVALQELTDPNYLVDGEMSPGGPPDAWAATERTVRYMVDSTSVRFIEK